MFYMVILIMDDISYRYLLAQLILRPRIALAFVAQRALGGEQQSLAVLR